MSGEPNEEKKIIIDEDWKSRVEAEKEEAAQEQARAADSGGAGAASGPAGPPLPPPNLTFLASTLYMQGMISLGLLPNPASDKPEVHLEHARHFIDMLQMLQEKTEGNRTPEETQELETMLHELRLSYVARRDQPTPSE